MDCKVTNVWGPLLRNRSLYAFGNNTAAIAGCVSGYSRSPYVARIVGAVHELLCTEQVKCWFEYVHSDSNPLDAASRQLFEAGIRQFGAAVVPVSATLKSDLSVYHPT